MGLESWERASQASSRTCSLFSIPMNGNLGRGQRIFLFGHVLMYSKFLIMQCCIVRVFPSCLIF